MINVQMTPEEASVVLTGLACWAGEQKAAGASDDAANETVRLYNTLAAQIDGDRPRKLPYFEPKRPIRSLTPDDRDYVREVVADAMTYWPNSHLGDNTPRQDMRSAFKFLRRHMDDGLSLHDACGRLSCDVARYVDM